MKIYERTCCYLQDGREDGESCRAWATVEIHANNDSADMGTDSCDEHVGRMLGTQPGLPDAAYWIVTPIVLAEV